MRHTLGRKAETNEKVTLLAVMRVTAMTQTTKTHCHAMLEPLIVRSSGDTQYDKTIKEMRKNCRTALAGTKCALKPATVNTVGRAAANFYDNKASTSKANLDNENATISTNVQSSKQKADVTIAKPKEENSSDLLDSILTGQKVCMQFTNNPMVQ